MTVKPALFALLMSMPLVIAGCSGHPGTGTWQAADTNSRFSTLQVAFDGKAELFNAAQPEPIMRCLWQGTSSETLQLQCRSADQPDTTLNFSLQIQADNGAVLYQQENVIARFNR